VRALRWGGATVLVGLALALPWWLAVGNQLKASAAMVPRNGRGASASQGPPLRSTWHRSGRACGRDSEGILFRHPSGSP